MKKMRFKPGDEIKCGCKRCKQKETPKQGIVEAFMTIHSCYILTGGWKTIHESKAVLIKAKKITDWRARIENGIQRRR